MVTRHALNRLKLRGVFVLLLLLAVFAGCQQEDGNDLGYIRPPVPSQARYTTLTENYFYHYNDGAGAPPFQSGWLFTNAQYPLTISYEDRTTTPSGIDVAFESENAIKCWSAADPRICAISRTTPDKARIRVILADDIAINGQVSNIIGLTSVDRSNVPSFKVEIATRYNANLSATGPPVYTPLSQMNIKKTIVHELGHTLGLGHSPDVHDLMYYRANDDVQGQTYQNFLTFGDAIALWTTLNAQRISWQRLPAVTLALAAPLAAQPSAAMKSLPRGQIVDIYTVQ